MVRHHFSVDVEEYFQVAALEDHIDRSDWHRLESRVTGPVHRILDLLAKAGARGTFFVVGWLAQRQPQLVRTIASAGHEVASHGWDHRVIEAQSRDAFRASARRSKAVLEDITGSPVLGFRAPCFSITPGREWALDTLIEEGYRYDSSLFPIRRYGHCYPGARRYAHWLHRPSGRLLEVPPATLRFLGFNVPAGGGAYFRFLPYEVLRSAFRQAERRNQPTTFYIHPWELDPDQPQLPVSVLTRIRHYYGLDGTLPRLERLLEEFRFVSIEASLNGAMADPPVTAAPDSLDGSVP